MALENQVTIVVTDYRDLLRQINKVEPGLASAVKRNIKEIAEIPRREIRSTIPSNAPIRGMRRKLSPVGKTWNTRNQARTVKIKQYNMSKAAPIGKEKSLSMVKLIIPSAAAIIADMSGRGTSRRTGKTDWYVYPSSNITTENYRPQMRRHTVNGQGDIMIRALNDKLGGSPSRMAYPAAEKKMPEVAEKFADLMGFVAGEIERDANG